MARSRSCIGCGRIHSRNATEPCPEAVRVEAEQAARVAAPVAHVNTEDGASFRADGSVFRVIGGNGIRGGNRDLD